MTRRFLAMLLAVVMVVSVSPVGVLAEGSGTPDPQAEQTTAEKHTKYSVLASHDHVENDAHICEHCVAAGAADTTPTWIAWGDDAAEKTQLPRESGHYYITGDLSKMTSTNLSDVSDRDIVICLNGKTLSCNNAYNTSNRFYTMGRNNKVTVLDCTAHVDGEGNYVAGTLKDATYCTIFFKNEMGNATFTMYDGIMADSVQRGANGGAIKAGGAILVHGPSRVNLYGGEIRNATGAGGGAIRLYSKGAVLDIDGATIRDCTSTGQGSAILVSESNDKAGANPTQITIRNAVITGNKNTALSSDACGGAIFVNSNTAVVTLGGNNQITGNTDKDGAEYNLFLQNIAGNQPKYTISGLATTARMGVRVAADRAAAADGLILTKTLGGANVAANFVSDDTSLKAEVKDDVVVLADAPLTHEGKTHICEHCLKEGKTGAEATPTWTAWGDDATETNLPTAEGHYYLTRDMQVKKAEITAGHVVLCLNGKTVTANGAANSADDRFYYLRNAGSISIVDCTAHTETEGGQDVYKAGKLTGATAAVIMAHEATTGRSTGSVNIYDGIITGNYRSSSGGTLAIQGNCKLNIYGGEFSNNRTDNNGAVINTIRSTNTVYIENAVFKNNTAKLHGAVLVGAGCDVTIKDTVMTGNVGGGVGVLKTSGTTVLENVTITDNRTAVSTNTAVPDNGAVWHNSTTKTLTLKGNTQITGNTFGDENATKLWNLNLATADNKIAINGLAATARIGVTAVKDAPFTDALTDADAVKGSFLPDDNTLEVSVQDSKLVLTQKNATPPQPPASNHTHKLCGDSACTDHAEMTFEAWTEATSLPTSGNYYLTQDVTLSATANITGTNDLKLCLNGHNIYCKSGATFRHFSVGGTGKLSITDCAATPGSLSNGGSGSILSTGDCAAGAQIDLFRISLKNNTRTTGGTIIAQGRAVFNLYDVEITGSNATSSSGVVYMQNYAQVNITGGSIHDNHSAGNGGVFNLTTAFNVLNVKGTEIKNNTTDTKGGVIYTEKACTVSFEDCVITGNHADNSEGGVAYLKTANSTFKNCRISENSANNGSTLVVFGGTCLLDGTKVQNNHAKSGYGAVHVNRSGDVTVTLQGETIIDGNTTGTANKIQNVYMRNSAYYLVIGALSGNAKVGITMENARLTAGLLNISSNDVSEAQTAFLHSDAAGYTVKVVGGKARLTADHGHNICADSACTEHAELAWSKWEATDSLPASGNYYLTADVQLGTFRAVSGTLNLCLNGHTITAAKDNRVFSVDNKGVLSITDCTGNGKITGGVKTYGGAVAVQQGGTFNLYGGKISGNSALTEEGGGVYIKGGNDTTNKGGIFNMYGGEISDNDARQGTAVRLTNSSGAGTNAVFNMYGGKITGNTAKTNGSAIYAGKSTVNIYGGEISGNTAGANGTIYAGADTALTITGGKITGNTAGIGAGVFVLSDETSVTLSGNAYITDNTTGEKPNNVFLAGNSILNLGALEEDAKIGVSVATANRAISATVATDYTANFSSDSAFKALSYKYQALYIESSTNHSHCLCAGAMTGCDHAVHSWQAWESGASLPTTDGYYYLTENVVLASQADISGNVKLCLNGYSISMKEGAQNVRALKLLLGAELSLTDCAGTGKISGGNASWGAGININRGAVFNMYGGIFTGNTSLDEAGGQGAAVYVQATKDGVAGGIFNMYGGTITQNEATWGGAVYGASKSTINIYGGTISENHSTKYGGGIYATGAETNITGGSFVKNTSGSGGAIYVTGAASKLNVTDATFTDNTVSGYAGGAILAQSNDTVIVLKNSKFTGSHATAGGAVYASTNTKLTVEKCTFSGNTADLGACIYTLRCDAKITGTTMEKNTAKTQAAGIYVSAGTCELTDVTIKNNKGGSGVAMMINSAKATIDGKNTVLYPTVTLVSGTISGNTTAEGSGAAVLMQGKSTLNMKGGSITGNSAKWCGGIYASTNSTFNMYGGYIGYNTTKQSGGGLYGLRCTMNLYGGTIANNTAEKNGGGIYISGAKLYLSGTQIIGNVAKTGTGGGGIGTGSQRVNNVLYEPYVKMTGGCISDNKGRHGGGVLLQGSSNTVFEMTGGKITGNEATEQPGGAFYVSTKTTLKVTGGEISGNLSAKQGGAIYHNNSNGIYENIEIVGNTAKSSGGALLVTGANTVVTAKNVKFYDHKGASGGTICHQGKAHMTMENVEIYNSEATNSGGALYVSNNTYIDMINVNIHDSFANLNGGAIFLGNNVYFTADGLTIENNKTAMEGGAIYSRSMHVLVKNAKISGNVSEGNGGAITTYKPAMQGVSNNGDYRTGYIFENSEFSNNTSKMQGGALYVDRGSKMTLINVQMTRNTATLEGGAVWTEGDFVVNGLTATGNTSKNGGYAVYLADSKYDGHSYFTGANQLGGDVIVNGNDGGDMYMGENTTAAMLEEGFGEKTNFNVTLHSGLLTNKLYGEYNYEGGNLIYTVTYGSRSLTEPEYEAPVQDTEPEETQPGTETTEPAAAGEDNTLLYAGIGGIAAVVVLAAIVLVIVKKKKTGNATGADNK